MNCPVCGKEVLLGRTYCSKECRKKVRGKKSYIKMLREQIRYHRGEVWRLKGLLASALSRRS